MTYKLCKLLIENNRYTYEDMYAKLDLFLMLGRITEEQYIELTGMLMPPEEPDESEFDPDMNETPDVSEDDTPDEQPDTDNDTESNKSEMI